VLTPEQAAALRDLLGAEPESLSPLAGGNNLVVALACKGERRVAKFYFSHPQDKRDRLGAEFSMLSFLWRQGVRCIPEPLAADRQRQVGLYRFVEGVHPRPGEVGPDDVRQLGDLLQRMAGLRDQAEAAQLPPASECSLSLRRYLDLVGGRLVRVRERLAREPQDALGRQARGYVEDEVVPLFEAAVRHTLAGAALDSPELDAELPQGERTITPADHGFHNTLRRTDGSLVFLDFEYAGWDDPAQTIGNACLQPAAPLPAAERASFVRRMTALFRDPGGLLARIERVYPLLALRWCLIMLNEFLPVDRERRGFAGADPDAGRGRQIEKSRGHLALAREALEGRNFLAEVKREFYAP
jgi:Phosphotransferase enzyme family.